MGLIDYFKPLLLASETAVPSIHRIVEISKIFFYKKSLKIFGIEPGSLDAQARMLTLGFAQTYLIGSELLID